MGSVHPSTAFHSQQAFPSTAMGCGKSTAKACTHVDSKAAVLEGANPNLLTGGLPEEVVTKETQEKAAKEDDATEELAKEEAPKEERAKEEESKDEEEKLPVLENKTAPNGSRWCVC